MQFLRRLLPLIGLFATLMVFALRLPPEWDSLGLKILLFVCALVAWVFVTGAGIRTVEKDSYEVVEEFFGGVSMYGPRKMYFFIPGYHLVEATLPNFPIKHEFSIDSIDTRTPGLQRIDKIKVRVSYSIVDPLTCYYQVLQSLERLKELEEQKKIRHSEMFLWKQVLNERLAGIIDDAIRVGVWHWADTLVRDPNLNLVTPFPLPPNTEYDPYALSLNRDRLAAEILDEVQYQTDEWGMQIDRLVFENFEINPEIIKRKVRNKDRELADAEHEARMAAAAITIKGEAEVEIRARTVARVIEVLLEQQRRNGLNLSNDVLYNVVRAAMYSDGQTIWKGVIEKSATPPGTAKTA